MTVAHTPASMVNMMLMQANKTLFTVFSFLRECTPKEELGMGHGPDTVMELQRIYSTDTNPSTSHVHAADTYAQAASVYDDELPTSPGGIGLADGYPDAPDAGAGAPGTHGLRVSG